MTEHKNTDNNQENNDYILELFEAQRLLRIGDISNANKLFAEIVKKYPEHVLGKAKKLPAEKDIKSSLT